MKEKVFNFLNGNSAFFCALTGETFTRRQVIVAHLVLVAGLILVGIAGAI